MKITRLEVIKVKPRWMFLKMHTDTDIYGTEGQNFYGNPFGNETLVAELSNGGVMRISENRNIGWKCPETFITSLTVQMVVIPLP